jgi:hypothetical protein
MKRIAQLAVLGALACGAQAVWSQEASIDATVAASESSQSNVSVAQAAAPAEQRYEATAPAKSRGGARDMLRELGLRGDDGFPQKGGPIDE